MKITAKRFRLAFRSPGNFFWAIRYVLRNSPLLRLEQRLLNGYSFRPNLISVNITSRCNLRCEMCMQPREKSGPGDTATLRGDRGEMTPEQWRGVVDQAAPARPAFYFTGGEPLLYKGLDAVIDHIKRRGMIAALVTNGSALAHHAERLVETGIDNVTVSIDGPEPVHDAIRGVPGAFRRAADGIRALQEARLRVGAAYPTIKVNCVVTPESFATLGETYEIIRGLGVDELNFQHPIFDTAENVTLHNRVFQKAMAAGGPEQNLPETPLPPATGETDPAAPETDSKRQGEFYDRRLTESEFDQLERTLREILTHAKDKPKVLFFPDVGPQDWRPYYLDLDFPFRNQCLAPWTMMRFLADGSFEPCLHHVVGNVRDTPLWDLWNAPAMRHFRRTLVETGLFPACVRCCYRAY